MFLARLANCTRAPTLVDTDTHLTPAVWTRVPVHVWDFLDYVQSHVALAVRALWKVDLASLGG